MVRTMATPFYRHKNFSLDPTLQINFHTAPCPLCSRLGGVAPAASHTPDTPSHAFFSCFHLALPRAELDRVASTFTSDHPLEYTHTVPPVRLTWQSLHEAQKLDLLIGVTLPTTAFHAITFPTTEAWQASFLNHTSPLIKDICSWRMALEHPI